MTHAWTLAVLLSAMSMALSEVMPQDSVGTDVRMRPAVKGYLKTLATGSFDGGFRDNVSDDLLHHRLNLRWKPSERFSSAVEIRNRVFWGETVSLTTGFGRSLRNPSEAFNMQHAWIDGHALVAHTNVERAWAEFRRGSLTLRAGRQRVNWSMATIWNPNDLFNAYNFLDFDYEERPGVDAARLSYIVSDLSGFEVAQVVLPDRKGITALRAYLNKGGYDLQLLAGMARGRPTFGAGWAGHLGEAGFRGEFQAYLPKPRQPAGFNMTAEVDRTFEKGWYIQAGILFNSKGRPLPLADFSEADFNLSSENLMPARWSMQASVRKEVTPLTVARLGFVYCPGMNLLILMNTLSHNISPNVDADFIWQSFFAEMGASFMAARHMAFLRLKWSY